MKVLAIIPARKGSKGIKNKNIQPLNGHPLIAYSIAAAVKSKKIDRVICSTNSEKIAKVARQYGAETPFLRPDRYSQDHSSDIEVFSHCLKWLYKNEGYTPEFVVQLRPTSPIRFLKDIDQGFNIIHRIKDIDSIRSVSEPTTTPYKMWQLDSKGNLEPILSLKNNKEPYNTARQLLPKVYAQTGTLEIIRTNTILTKKSMTGDKIYPLFINQKFFIDIDTMSSMQIAENVIKNTNCIKP